MGVFTAPMPGFWKVLSQGGYNDIPARGNVRIEVGGRTYSRIGWTFYQPQSEEGATSYVEVPPPYGAMLDTLPPKYETAVIDEKPYYRFDGVYFVAVAMNGGTKYVVVKPPSQSNQRNPTESPH